MILSSLLSSSKYIIVNKDLIKVLGLHEAIILGELCSEYSYWESMKQLEKNEYFYSTRENIEKNTGINAHYQRIAIKVLEDKGIIISKRMGIPCKKYYKINENKVIEYLKEARIIDNSTVVNEVNDKTYTKDISKDKSNEMQDEDSIDLNNNNINNKIINNEEHTHEQNSAEEKIEYADKVTMTEREYNDLLNTYGEEMTKQLIKQLSLYKQTNNKSYDSDYSAIQYWVIERVHEIEKKDANYKAFKNKKDNTKKVNFNQREYPPEFFNSLYAN